jgi:hypothetical protein
VTDFSCDKKGTAFRDEHVSVLFICESLRFFLR